MIVYGTRGIDGLTTSVVSVAITEEIKDGDLTGAEIGTLYTMDSSGTPVQMMPIGINRDPSAYHMTTVTVTPSIVYTYSGKCTSPGATISLTPESSMACVSASEDDNYVSYDANSLHNGIVASVIADSDGSFSIPHIGGLEGNVIVWMQTSASASEMLGGGIQCDVEMENDPNKEVITLAVKLSPGKEEPMPCYTCGGTGVPNELMFDACPICQGSGKNPLNAEEPCTGCSGSGQVVTNGKICPTCSGSGFNPENEQEVCDVCGGVGYICNTCHGSGSNITLYAPAMYQIYGTCSDDVERVYLTLRMSTVIYDTDALSSWSKELGVGDYAYLSNHIIASSEPSDGTFMLTYDDGGQTDYVSHVCVVWAELKDGTSLSIDEIIVGEGSCLSGDTLITMMDGSQCRLDEIQVGTFVAAASGKKTRVNRIARGYFNDHHILYHFSDGTIIDETHPHRFYNVEQGFYQILNKWNIGDHALNQNGEKIALVSIERFDEHAEMFGIFTDSGTYYANGLLSGMAMCNKQFLSNATAEQAVDMLLSVDERIVLQLLGMEELLP